MFKMFKMFNKKKEKLSPEMTKKTELNNYLNALLSSYLKIEDEEKRKSLINEIIEFSIYFPFSAQELVDFIYRKVQETMPPEITKNDQEKKERVSGFFEQFSFDYHKKIILGILEELKKKEQKGAKNE